MNTTWGQYALCNNNVCAGGNDFSVGREAPTGIKPFGGQCTNNNVRHLASFLAFSPSFYADQSTGI